MALPCPLPSTALLTSDDLDEISHSVRSLDRPLEVVAELVEAVDQGQLADAADTGYALLLAAEISEGTGDVAAAAALAARAVEEARLHGLEYDDEDTISRLRVSGRGRLSGFRRDAQFSALWWDPKHEIYPRTKRHT